MGKSKFVEHYGNELNKLLELDEDGKFTPQGMVLKKFYCNNYCCDKDCVRFDAKCLGYPISYTKGTPKTRNCKGCYLNNPKDFEIQAAKYKK